MPNQNPASEHRYHLLTADRPLSTEKILPREHLLRAVAEGFRGHRFVLLHGKSGIGKTKLAELIFRRGRTENAFAAWYRFTGDFQKDFYLQITDHALLERLETQIAFGKENGLGSDLIDQRCAHVCRQYWEEYCPGPKMIIIDGVQDFHTLAQHLHLLDIPDARVLITTQTLPADDDFRLRDAFSFAVVEVPPLDSSELETMLGYFGQTIEDAQLAEYLGQSPLLLRLFLKNNTPEQPEKSRALVARLLREVPGEDLDGRLIYALLDFADLPPAILWTLMQMAAMPDKFHDPDLLAAFLGTKPGESLTDNSSYCTFRTRAGAGKKKEEKHIITEVLDLSMKHGWIEQNQQGAVSCHKAIRASIRDRLTLEFEYFASLADQITEAFFMSEASFEEGQMDKSDLLLRKVSDEELEESMSAFVNFLCDEDSDEFIDLLERYAYLLEHKAKWSAELIARRRLVDIWEKKTGRHDDGRLTAWVKLGHCLTRNGLYVESNECFQHILHEREKGFAVSNSNLANVHSSIGSNLESLGEYGKAFEYKKSALDIWKSIWPTQDEDLVFAYFGYAEILSLLGDYTAALEILARICVMKEGNNTSRAPTLDLIYNTIGSIHFNTGEYEKALDFTRKALIIQEENLPSNHPALATTFHNIGATLRDLGQLKEALVYEFRALDIRMAVLPSQHPETALTFAAIGACYWAMEDYHKALEYKIKALEIQKLVLPPLHSHLANSYDNLGSSYLGLSQLEQALFFKLKALKIWEVMRKPDRFDLAMCYTGLCQVYRMLKDYSTALEYGNRALEVKLATSRNSHNVNWAKTYLALGWLHNDIGVYDKALMFGMMALDSQKGVLIDRHFQILKTFKFLAEIHNNLYDEINAEKYRRLANPET